ncbi:hypothetical protein P4C99_21160, partial [Pontiellaceae bacterium B1224]|nr:hypothetical protein [Pontiellaceae bacterium B1224]
RLFRFTNRLPPDNWQARRKLGLCLGANSDRLLDGNEMGQYANGATGAGILATLEFVADDTEFSFLIEHIEKDGTDMDKLILNAVAVHRIDDPADAFNDWLSSHGLSGDNALPNADIEPDGFDNLMEYALGGNPTNDDSTSIAPHVYFAHDSGVDYFYHVHNRNTDPTLTFTLGTTEDLTVPTDSDDVFIIGESSESGGFKTVTNRTEASSDSKFIKLEVTQ